jgi:AcrR family transcriptional regulator
MDGASPPTSSSEGDDQAPDGRRQRSRSSRARIVSALLELVEQGDPNPSAARVAVTAGVGLRTVFRHFDDMDALYQQMAWAIEAKVLPLALLPFHATDWRDQIRELVVRRATVFEAIMPFRISSSVKRFQSSFLMQDYRRMQQVEMASIDAILPPDIRANRTYAGALCVPLSFQCWRLLRDDQGLDFDEARAIVTQLVEAVLAQIK